MKNAFDIVTDVRSLINVDTILNVITGKVWPFYRPGNIDKIDIVVWVLNADNEWMQEADVNVRLHVPGLERLTEGRFQTVPDLARFKYINGLLLPLLDEQYRETFNTEVDIPGEIIQDTDGTYFSLIRVTYRSMQENYQNL